MEDFSPEAMAVKEKLPTLSQELKDLLVKAKAQQSLIASMADMDQYLLGKKAKSR